MCEACDRCAVVSFSTRWNECSWFAECDIWEGGLHEDVAGFTTHRVKKVPAPVPARDGTTRSHMLQPGAGLCVVLHMCSRKRLLADYADASRRWDDAAAAHPSFAVYFVDSCRNLSASHPYETPRMHRIPFEQRSPAKARFWLTAFEMDQMSAALAYLPQQCTHVVKLTGKYFSPALPPYLDSLSGNLPTLALQARGPSYQGWASELFIISRRLLAIQMHRHTNVRSFGRTEEWLSYIRRTLMAVNVSVHYLPRFPLARSVHRSGDHALMTWL